MKLNNLTPFFLIGVLPWLILFVISSILLYKTLKQRVIIQIIIYSSCFLFTGYMAFTRFSNIVDFWKEERKVQKQLFNNVKKGDTVIMEGIIGFSCYNPYFKQDSLLNLIPHDDTANQERANYIYIVIPIKEHGLVFEHQKTIKMSASQFRSLNKYLNYQQQKKDTISYRLKLKVQNIENNNYGSQWNLINVIKIDVIKKLPPIENSICEESPAGNSSQ